MWSTIEIKCPEPPPLPPNYIPRQYLLDKVVTKLGDVTIDSEIYGVSLIITGAGGFGKTSIVAALCHHAYIKEQFQDGIIFIELGPQATDPSMKLKGLYNLLTDKHCDVNVAEQQIKELTNLHYHNLLVIIDDVWHVEDAEPIVKAFSNCKIVLTTRMNDIDIPTKHTVSVGPMEQKEAISLLTFGVIDVSQLSPDDVSLLDELAQDVHLWPLLLSLIRGHLSHNLKQHHLSRQLAIQHVQAKLRDRGLTAFDKNNIERSRKYAARSCIEVSLDLLTKPLSDKMKTLILWTGIGGALQTAVLHNLWKVADYEAQDIVGELWSYGLVHFTDIIIPPHNNPQHCVEVHAVITQYIIECLASKDVQRLSPFGDLKTCDSVKNALMKQFQNLSGVHDTRLLSDVEYLHYRANEIEYRSLPHQLQMINMCRILDPHTTIMLLEQIEIAIKSSPNVQKSLPSIFEHINLLINQCHKILKDAHRSTRRLNQKFQLCVTQRNYDGLNEAIETYMQQYPITTVTQQAVVMVKKVIPCCEKEILFNMKIHCEKLCFTTCNYHVITLLIAPMIKLLTKELQLLFTSFETGSPMIEQTIESYQSGKIDEEFDLLTINNHIKLQEVAPYHAASLQDTYQMHSYSY